MTRLTLIQWDYPDFEGRNRPANRAFDLMVASLALVVFTRSCS